ncbi:RING/U-box [Glarea lozoyensis ATCC 20868]|uniref:RBR-type E3 ubiquitin transferase n=1 Tax=Glarea lozoyensis (strain ATCC 20868 / MF5171) TaxID=1116229 RepID=S3D3D1_GLAL2|nr:RING/U-box [Glarea lozoyensis ATCC 20868]EPE26581.1 RING/U-box [Glarea lozoyensis ATCC 20868]
MNPKNSNQTMSTVTRPPHPRKASLRLRTTKVFDQQFSDLSNSTLKKLLALFKQRLRPRQTRRILIQRVLELSHLITSSEHNAVSGLLKRGAPLTHRQISEWPTFPSSYTKTFCSSKHSRAVCKSCGSDNAETRIREGKLDPKCNDECCICEDCMRSYVAARLTDHNYTHLWGRVACPCCNSVLSPNTVRSFLSHRLLQPYTEFVYSQHLRHLENFRWCADDNCHSGQIHHDGDENPQMTCVKCSKVTCFTHAYFWHEGNKRGDHNAMTYASFSSPENMASRSQEIMHRTCKTCPRCRAPIQKYDGCNLVHCENCNHDFNHEKALRPPKGLTR